MSRFFVVTPLGFEEGTLREMRRCWPLLLGKDSRPTTDPFPEVSMLKGGLEFECELILGVQLNFFLKTASRVLLRMASFKVRDFPKFYQKVKSLPWADYLKHGNVEWVVAAQKSRLNNEKRLQEIGEEIFAEVFKGDHETTPCGSVYIRMEDDLCTVSLDSSGEHLHKRGWSVLRGEAPLRETIAAALLFEMIGSSPISDLQGLTLVDPMSGSGTFLSEARALYCAQVARPFAFQNWKKCPKLFLSPTFALNYQQTAVDPFKAYLGTDIDSKMNEVAAKNFSELERQLEAQQKKQFKTAAVEWKCADALDEQVEVELGPNWLICNPPYGERLPLAAQGGLSAVTAALAAKYQPLRLGILYPEKDRVKKAPKGYKLFKEVSINNGGLKTLFTILTRV